MIKTLHPYSNTAKTAEIMSRYRPIAPKPETPGNSVADGSSLCQKIKQSPYLRNLWPQLQARPTRTRKRGRASMPLLPSLKRQKTQVLGFCSPCHVTSPAKNLSLQSFTHSHSLPQLPPPPPNHGMLNSGWEKPSNNTPSLVTLPLLPCSPPETATVKGEETIDLNTTAEIPEEKDLLQQLQTPAVSIVIAPRPVRPLGSSISVGCINEDPGLPPASRAPKTPEEVELEVESEALPVVISDSNNQVRMANSAYKEMVGQPECPWLDSMVTGDGRLPCRSCKRISGEVTLRLCDSSVPISSSGFTCWVRIEWKPNEKISSLNAFCDVLRLSCESRDYLFKWRFHTRTPTREGSQSSCNV
ncbi:LOW QUALITY PROTEIN: uncharacterized protein LOC114751575 [Neltuma alba]|uniref:LOW QUALITY PROTEIN: uncharacterized protein LOC114751575 n=1 Tax=Neltuma alba TaxID=207710 RepID=UPI0010A31A94|nr:LOW QUALITY PROTEIN: uncharacterized protein LOC114751575 [Prosopis alba]